MIHTVVNEAEVNVVLELSFFFFFFFDSTDVGNFVRGSTLIETAHPGQAPQ